MISAPELAERIGKRVQLKRCNPTTFLGFCPQPGCRTREPHFWVFHGKKGEGMFKCQSCGWNGGEAVWRNFVGEIPRKPNAEERNAARRRRREEALERRAAQRIAALLDGHPDTMPEAVMFGRDALREWMTKRLGWKP